MTSPDDVRPAERTAERSGPKNSAFENRWLGKYRLIEEIGRGGMGVVYLAEDPPLNRRVALKVLPHSVAQETRVVQRFLREAQAAARLRHRNIIPIYSAGELEGTYYYSMEYVPGVTLAQVIRALRERKLAQRGALLVERVAEDGHPKLKLTHDSRVISAASLEDLTRASGREPILTFSQRNYVHEALRLFVEVAEALHYAHGKGIVHRDIKPSNLLLAPDGRLLLADFGLAKIGDARSITKTGDLLGSPSYMSPEQTMTRRVPVDHRTDIWSLGVTLFELLTLRHPFEARNLEVSLRNIVAAEPPPPRKFNPRLPKDVETILQKTLEKNPDARYQTAEELAADLRCVLNYELIQAKSRGPITRSIRFVRRNSSRIVVGLLTVLLLIVGTLAFMMYQDRKVHDLDQGIAYVRGKTEREMSDPHARKTLEEIQADLRTLRAEAPSLGAAIDLLSFRTIREAESYLPGEESIGDLAAAMKALGKLRLIRLHDPDEEERERLARVDRATAEARVKLIWAIFDRLAAVSQPDVPADLWQWLCHFLGTEQATMGVPKERNALVRRNAIEAVSRLASHRTFGVEVIPLLLRVVADEDAEEMVQCEAVQALATIDGAAEDSQTLELLAALMEGDDHFMLPPLTRYRAAEILFRSTQRVRFRSVFERLCADPADAVREFAETTVEEFESS